MRVQTSPRMVRTKCYIHEMQRPSELPYERLQYHVCWICQSRLLELAKADFQFKLGEDRVAVSITPEVQETEAVPQKGNKVKKR